VRRIASARSPFIFFLFLLHGMEEGKSAHFLGAERCVFTGDFSVLWVGGLTAFRSGRCRKGLEEAGASLESPHRRGTSPPHGHSSHAVACYSPVPCRFLSSPANTPKREIPNNHAVIYRSKNVPKGSFRPVNIEVEIKKARPQPGRAFTFPRRHP
jgi:hypothetical protein